MWVNIVKNPILLQYIFKFLYYLCFHVYSSNAMKLLIIEDERELSASIVAYLSSENYVCEQAFTYAEALEKVGLYDYDCVLLDLMLPGGNGLDILREIRKRQNPVGVIIVSAKDSLDDKVRGLEIGADDYLAKPFHLPELSMRIYAIIRRKEFAANNLLRSNGIEINLPAKSVSVKGRPVMLTRTEYELLLFFIGNAGKVVSKAAMAEHLSGKAGGGGRKGLRQECVWDGV